MSTAALDLDALASQHGGRLASVDLDSLAASHGGKPATGAVEKPSAYPRIHTAFTGVPGADSGGGMVDLAEGATSRAIHTLLGAYHLLRQIPGVGDKLPAPSAFIESLGETPDTDTLGAKAGRIAEQAAEYAVPAGKLEAATAGASRLVRAAAQAGAAGAIAGAQTSGDPTAIGVNAGLGALGVPLSDAVQFLGNKLLNPETLYRTALKPTRKMLESNPGMLRAGIEAGITVPPRSMAVIHDAIEDLRDQINNGVAGNPGTVDPSKVVSALDELRGMYQNSANPNIGGGIKAVDKVRDQFLRAHGAVPPGQAGTVAQPMSLDEAQQAKINTHILLRDAYGDMKGAEVEATKQAARGLKEQIEAVFPEIAGLNQKQSDLMGLDEAMQRRVWQMENPTSTGFHTIPGTVKKALEMPELRSRLAIALASKGIENPGDLIASRLKNLIAAGQAAVSQNTEGAQ